MDLLGWFSTTSSPNFHPSQKHVACHRILQKYNESLILLLLNPYAAAASIGGKLPIGIYESVLEGGEAVTAGEGGNFKFVPTKYTVETGEAEMIGVDFVAKGGWGNAAAITEQGGKPGAAAGEAVGPAGDPIQQTGEGGAKDGKSEDVTMGQSNDFVGTQNDERMFPRFFLFQSWGANLSFML